MKKIKVLILAQVLISASSASFSLAQTNIPADKQQSLSAVYEQQLDAQKVPRTLEERQALASRLFPNDEAAQQSFVAITDRFALRDIINKRKEKSDLEGRPRLLADSPSARVLEDKIVRSDNQDDEAKVILDAGDSGDNSLIPYLKFLLDHGNPREAAVALVNLGETEYLDQMLRDSRSNNPRIQGDAAYQLVQVGRKGNKAAMHRLYELLDETKTPPSDGDLVYVPIAYSVVGMLSDVTPNPPSTKENNEAIALWKKWFEKNGLN